MLENGLYGLFGLTTHELHTYTNTETDPSHSWRSYFFHFPPPFHHHDACVVLFYKPDIVELLRSRGFFMSTSPWHCTTLSLAKITFF